jgi:hypothetical protein
MKRSAILALVIGLFLCALAPAANAGPPPPLSGNTFIRINLVFNFDTQQGEFEAWERSHNLYFHGTAADEGVGSFEPTSWLTCGDGDDTYQVTRTGTVSGEVKTFTILGEVPDEGEPEVGSFAVDFSVSITFPIDDPNCPISQRGSAHGGWTLIPESGSGLFENLVGGHGIVLSSHSGNIGYENWSGLFQFER